MNTYSYLSHWQVTQPIFMGQVAPEHLYIPSHLEPLLQRGTVFSQQQGGGLIVWGGARGSGRTAIAKRLYASTDLVSTEPLLVTMVQEETSSGWLINRLVRLFSSREKSKAKTSPNPFKEIAANFERVLGEGRGLAIFVDAAEHIRSSAALSDIASLLNLQSLASTRLSVSLFGTDALSELCKKSQSVASRMLCHLSIQPLDPNQVASYVEQRCMLVGLKGTLFEPAAVPQLWSLSGGNISKINALAENSLMEAARLGLKQVSQRAVTAATQYLDVQRPPRARDPGTRDESPPPVPGSQGSQSLASLFRVPPGTKPSKKEGE